MGISYDICRLVNFSVNFPFLQCLPLLNIGLPKAPLPGIQVSQNTAFGPTNRSMRLSMRNMQSMERSTPPPNSYLVIAPAIPSSTLITLVGLAASMMKKGLFQVLNEHLRCSLEARTY